MNEMFIILLLESLYQVMKEHIDLKPDMPKSDILTYSLFRHQVHTRSLWAFICWYKCDTTLSLATLPRRSERASKSEDEIENEGEDESEGKGNCEGEGGSENGAIARNYYA